MAQYGGNPLPDETLDAIRETGVALKGLITTPVGGGFRSVNVGLVEGARPLRPGPSAEDLPGRPHPLRGRRPRRHSREHGRTSAPGSSTSRARTTRPSCLSGSRARWEARWDDAGISIKPISVTGTRRIFEFAFDYARRMGRRKVTAVHKANIMKFTDGLWLHVAREVAAENDDVEFDDRIVDNMHAARAAARGVRRPVLPNLYGDVVSDLCAGMIGGSGWRRARTSASRSRCSSLMHGFRRRSTPGRTRSTRWPRCCRGC